MTPPDQPLSATLPEAPDFLAGDDEVTRLMRARDWSDSPLGPPAAWPPSLVAATRLMLASKAQIVIFWGPDLAALYNTTYAPTIGDKHPRALGRPARENWSELWDILEPLLQGVMRDGETFHGHDYPFRIQRHGYLEEIYFDVSYAPVRDEAGRIEGVFCIVSETTGRVLGERRLRTLRELSVAVSPETALSEVCRVSLDAIAATNPRDLPYAAIYLLDPPGERGARTLSLAAHYGIAAPETRLRLDPGTVAGATLARVVDGMCPEDLLAARLFGSLPAGAADTLVALPLVAGRSVAGVFLAGLSGMLALSQPYRDFLDLVASRTAKGLTLARILMDERQRGDELQAQVAAAVARHAHTEAQLHQAQKMDAVGKLTGGVAHDFNNLLQVIGGNLQLLARDLPDNSRGAQRLASALNAVERGSKLASQLLAFGRRQPLEPRAVNFGRLMRGMDEILRRALGEEIEVETVIAGGLWNTLADPVQVENALLNLAINARDAMGGRGRLTIEAGNAFLDDAYARAHADVTAGQYVMLAVTDTGAGIAPEHLDQVFEPFFTTKPEGQGTGLGLSMVYGFAKQSGGHAKIYSELGHGTTVRLYLPRTSQPEDLAQPVDTGPVSGGAETVLVVEDDDNVRTTVVEMLMDLGYRVLKAGDAQSALAILESGLPIDLLFTDVVMPGLLRSPDLARRARERQPGIAVLFTSGYTENAIVHGGRLDEGANLLSKPYGRDALARKIRQVLATQQQLNHARQASAPDPGAGASGGPGRQESEPLRILLVEDEVLIRMTSVDFLTGMGHSVLEAGDAREALELLDAEEVDLLLTDDGLPGLSGTELALRVRSRLPTLPLIFATGRGAIDGMTSNPALAGAVLLAKPYGEAQLAAAVKRALGG